MEWSQWSLLLYSGNVREKREISLTDDILTTPNNPPGELISSQVFTSKASAATTKTISTTIRATETTTTTCKHCVTNTTLSSVSTDGKHGYALIRKLFADTQQVHSKYTCLPNCQKSLDNWLVWMKGKARKTFQHDWLLQSKCLMSKQNFGGWFMLKIKEYTVYYARNMEVKMIHGPGFLARN